MEPPKAGGEPRVVVDLEEAPNAASQLREVAKQSEMLKRQVQHLQSPTASPLAPKQLFQSKSAENLAAELPPAPTHVPQSASSEGKGVEQVADGNPSPSEEEIAEEFDLDKEERTSVHRRVRCVRS